MHWLLAPDIWRLLRSYASCLVNKSNSRHSHINQLNFRVFVCFIWGTSEAWDVLRYLCAFVPKNSATPFVDYAGFPEHPSQAVLRVCNARCWAFRVNRDMSKLYGFPIRVTTWPELWLHPWQVLTGWEQWSSLWHFPASEISPIGI